MMRRTIIAPLVLATGLVLPGRLLADRMEEAFAHPPTREADGPRAGRDRLALPADPAALKQEADRALADGRTPEPEGRVPDAILPAWERCLARAEQMLAHGAPVADVVYLVQETARFAREPALPEGYAARDLSPAALAGLKVRGGRLLLPDGAAAALIVLPPLEFLDLRVLDRLADAVRDGVNLLGPPPRHAARPDQARKFRTLVAELWGGESPAPETVRKMGRGRVMTHSALAPALAAAGLSPDFAVAGTDVRWWHRAEDGTDVYFLLNPGGEATVVHPWFRVTGRAPELWDPLTGRIHRTARFEAGPAGTRVTVPLGPAGSVFVVFRGKAPAAAAVTDVLRDGLPDPGVPVVFTPRGYETRVESAGTYALVLGDGRRLPFTVEAIPPPLEIAAAAFELPADYLAPGRHVVLDLGGTDGIVEVTLNGQTFPPGWLPPHVVDVTSELKPGANRLDVRLTPPPTNAVPARLRFATRVSLP